jgi:hypothetical protein
MKRRVIIIIGGTLAVVSIATFIALRPVPLQGKFPSDFSDADKKEIGSLVRSDAYHRSFSALRHGDFKSSWRWVVSARKQRVWAVGNQPNGDIWVHLGVEDESERDGYQISARYFMKKENEHWKLGKLF